MAANVGNIVPCTVTVITDRCLTSLVTVMIGNANSYGKNPVDNILLIPLMDVC